MSLDRADLEAGSLISHYRILGKLGDGGMGIVYRAADVRLHREVALKFLPAHVSDEEDAKERFLREARAASALDHPNICTIHQVGETDDGRLFIAMACYQGETLKDKIDQGPLAVDEAVRIVHQVGTGLAKAHGQHIIHRDIKPANIFVTTEGPTQPGGVKILDFGLAKAVGQVGGLTKTGLSMGTPTYMSPEQARGDELDGRSDLWSLGVVLYEALTGRRPFHGPNLPAVIFAISTADPEDVRSLRPEISGELAAVLSRLLSRRPDDSYASCEELLRDLELAVGWTPGGAVGGPALRGSAPIPIEDAQERTVVLDKTAARSGGADPVSRTRSARGPAAIAAAVIVLVTAGVMSWRTSFERASAGKESSEKRPPDRPSMAVLFFDNRTRDPALEWLRTGLADMLVTSLSQSSEIRVLPASKIHQVLKELGIDSAQDSFTLVEAVAESTGVEQVLVGSVARAGDRFRIDVKIQQADDGEVLFARQEDGDGEESLFTMIDRISDGIRRQLSLANVAPGASLQSEIRAVTTSSVEAYRLYVEALGLEFEGEDRKAAGQLRRAVAVDPGFSLAWSKLSSVYFGLGDFSRSEEASLKAWEGRDRLPPLELHLVEAQSFARNQEIEKAIAANTRVLEMDPDHLSARTSLVGQLASIERYDEALRHEASLLRHENVSPAALSVLATVHAAVGQFERAEELLEDYSRRGAQNGLGDFLLGELYRRWGRFDPSLDYLKRAQELRPDDPWVADGICMTLAVSGDWRGALDLADGRTARGGPFPFFADVCRLLALQLAGRSKEVSRVVERMTTEAPTEQTLVAVHNWNAIFQLDLGNATAARDAASRSRELASEASYPRASSLLVGALAELRLGHPEAAAELATQLRELASRSPSPFLERMVLRYRGERALTEGDSATAVAELERAATLLPPHGRSTPAYEADHVGLLYPLATALRAAGDEDRAGEVLARIAAAIDEQASFPILYVRSLYLLGRHHADRGEVAKATVAFQRFLHHWGDGDVEPERIEEARAYLSAHP